MKSSVPSNSTPLPYFPVTVVFVVKLYMVPSLLYVELSCTVPSESTYSKFHQPMRVRFQSMKAE